MSDPSLPGPPSSVSITFADDSTWINLKWTASTKAPVATSYLVQWRPHVSGSPPAASAAPWQQALTQATEQRIDGLKKDAKYDLEIYAKAPDGKGGFLTSAAYSRLVSMLPEDTSQDRFFSVLVPADKGASYLRIGPADLSTVEKTLLDSWTETKAPKVPASMDIGPDATTGALIYSSQDVAVMAAGDIRLRTPGALNLGSTSWTVATSGNTASITTTKNADGSSADRIIVFSKTYEQIGGWWTTKYDNSYGLTFQENTVGNFKLASTYDFFTGLKAGNAFSSGFDSKVNLADVTVAFAGLSVAMGWDSLVTKVAGTEIKFSDKSKTTAGSVRLELSDEVELPLNANLKTASSVMVALSAVVTLFGVVVTATQWGYLGTASADAAKKSSDTALENFLNTTAVPFFLIAQAANAVLFTVGVVLGVLHWNLKRITKPNVLTTFIELKRNLLTTEITINNKSSKLILDDTGLGMIGTSGHMTIEPTELSMKMYVPANSEIKMEPTGTTVSADVPIVIKSLMSVKFECGPCSIELTPAGINITGTPTKLNGALIQVM